MAKFNFYQYVWIFIFGCYSGYGVETLWCLIRNGFIESRKSLVLGHLSVAYGMGAVLLTLLLVHFQNSSWWKTFLVSFVSGTVVEYICSLGQEICFGSVAWDYSHLPLNINGRVCLLYSVFWGVLGLLWVKFVIPFMSKCFDKLSIPLSKLSIPLDKVIIWAFIVFFVFDAALSASAAVRMNQRNDGKEPRNKFEQFLDTHYDNETMQKIYANSKSVEE
ncbi:MAG: putative ABC transporter permease [Oscillospiraceae bacterium]|nr:putative ABC transporter permease [Oscillospiraceae bacterium]